MANKVTQVMKVADDFLPTVILQSLTVGKSGGLEMLASFRENPSTKDVPIIVFSSNEDAEQKAKVFESGANDYIVKSEDSLELISRIKNHSREYFNQMKGKMGTCWQITGESEVTKVFMIDDSKISCRMVGQLLGGEENVAFSFCNDPVYAIKSAKFFSPTVILLDLHMPQIHGLDLLRNFREDPSTCDIPIIMLSASSEPTIKAKAFGLGATDILFKYHGTIDEFIGDAILAIFEAPLPNEKHLEAAVACALEMQVAMKKVNEMNQKEGLPEVEMGIGLNTGEVVVGNIGSEKRTKYGVIGKNVNLTSRIESYTTGGQVFISERTMEYVRDIAKFRGEITAEPKGVKEPIIIYDLSSIEGEYNISLSDEKMKFFELTEQINLVFSIIEGKSKSQEEYSATIIKLAKKGAVICSEKKMEPLKNIRITLKDKGGRREIDMDIFAKVLQVDEEAPSTFTIRFTYWTPDQKNIWSNVGLNKTPVFFLWLEIRRSPVEQFHSLLYALY